MSWGGRWGVRPGSMEWGFRVRQDAERFKRIERVMGARRHAFEACKPIKATEDHDPGDEGDPR